MNSVMLIGRLGQAPNVKTTTAGVIVAHASLATSRSYKDRDGKWQNVSTWHELTAFRKTAQKLATLDKGQMVIVIGQVSVDEWTTEDGKNRKLVGVLVDRIFKCEPIRVPSEQPDPSEEELQPY